MESTTCEIAGHADVYGLGIRLGFYLHWYGGLLAGWLAPDEVPQMRWTLGLFVAATFASLVALRDALAAPETYVALLFLVGSALYIVPQCLFGALGFLGGRWALPIRTVQPPRRPTPLLLWAALATAELAFMLWFWLRRVPALGAADPCARYGFMFAKIPLDSHGFLVFHASLAAVMILSFLSEADQERISMDAVPTVVSDAALRFRYARIYLLVNLTELFVTAVVTTAIEVSIAWNGIRGVGSVDTTAQLIPLLAGAGAILRIFYVFLFRETDPLRDGCSLEDIKNTTKDTIYHPVTWYAFPDFYCVRHRTSEEDLPPHDSEETPAQSAPAMTGV
ncbi:hypothetical protein F4818DRAFT_214811 [Hypoxylon cercidicola]|nr:hypothetical protein F4818DRAFT_214811 [Hypoxylon cercidicola]